ncbi:CPBP family intramembrane metalloprotease [Candidatus Babeliales bacterium]|nr:CPBP family intramembrane metalloprotease [Candidatus Babeliales bacterium]
MIAQKIYRSVGSLIAAALSLFLWSYAFQAGVYYFDLGINILSEKNMGKIIFTFLVLLHVDLFLRLQKKEYVDTFYQTMFSFFYSWRSLISFFYYFFLFFLIHVAVLGLFVSMGHASFISFSSSLSYYFFKKTMWGFIATFFLVWSEEAIFRAALFNHFNRFVSVKPAIFVTSLCFMVAHSLQDPVHFFIHEWRIAVGLFLFGVMLNSLYVSTGKIITSMGAHAGVVFVKVLQRRILFVQFMPQISSIWLIDADLRQSLLAYLLFSACAFYFLYKKNIEKSSIL